MKDVKKKRNEEKNVNIQSIEINSKLLLKILLIITSIIFVIPSIKYIIDNGTIMNFNTYYDFTFNDLTDNKNISTIMYLILLIISSVIYVLMIGKNKIFQNIKQLLIYVGVISLIFMVMLPWTSSDIFYYMGVGEIDSVYHQNPYYVTIEDVYNENNGNIQDEILEKSVTNPWSSTTVVYGPMAQLLFKITTKISFKNVDLCLFMFKIINILLHILNCYLIYKITKKIKFSIIYGLNPLIFLEFIGNVHHDIVIVTFVLLALYFLLKKKQIVPSVIFLSIATGIKYYPILLLPIVILHYFKDEKKISRRIIKCMKYGILFVVVLALQYLIYAKDFSILTAMLIQNSKYYKTIYAGLAFGFEKQMPVIEMRRLVLIIFVVAYIKFCFKLLFNKEQKFYKIIRKYNWLLILFILSLSNFQQTYYIWLLPTIMWQKGDMIKCIIGLTIASEIGNSIFMFYEEDSKYDLIFVLITVLGTLILLLTNKKLIKNNKKLNNKQLQL